MHMTSTAAENSRLLLFDRDWHDGGPCTHELHASMYAMLAMETWL